MGKAKRTLGVIMAALMLVVTCMTYVPAKAAVVLPTVKFVGLQNIPAAVGEEQTLFLTSDFTGNVQYQVFYVQRNDPSKAAATTWTKLGDWTTAADAKTPVEVKVPANTITVAGNYSFAIRVKRAGVTGTYSNTYGDYDAAYPFNYAFAATATAGLKDAKLASAEVAVGQKFVISGLTAGNSYRLFTLNEARAQRWDAAAVATSTTNTIEWAPTVAGNYVLDLQLVDAAGKVTAVKLFNVKVTDKLAVQSVSAVKANTLKVTLNAAVDTAKAVLTVKKGSTTIATAAPVWNDAKTEATIAKSSSNFVAGDYTVTLSGLDNIDANKASGTVTIKDQTVTKIEFVGSDLVKAADGQSGTFKYVVKDQYGESMTKYVTLSSSCSVNGLALDSSTGTGTVTYDFATDVLTKAVVVVLVDPSTGVNATATLNVANAVKIQSVEFGAVTLPTGLTRLQVSNTESTMALTAKDQYGNVIDDTAILANAMNLLSSSQDVAFDYDYDEDGNTIITIDTSAVTEATTVLLTAVVKNDGRTFTKTFDVALAAAAKSLTFGEFSKDIIANGDTVYMPITVIDQFGTELTKAQIAAQATAINAKITTPSVISNGGVVTDRNSSHYGEYKFTAANVGTGVIVSTSTSGVVTKTITVKAARVLAEVVAPATINLMQGATKNVYFTFLDQYGVEMDAENNADMKYTVTLTKVSGTDAAVTTGFAPIYVAGDATTVGADESDLAVIPVVAASTVTGSYKLTVKLIDAADADVVATVAPADVLSSASVTINTVKNNVSGLTYSITAIPTLAGNSGSAYNKNSQYARDITVVAKDASGNSYVINPVDIVSVSSSNTSVADVDLATMKVWGKDITGNNNTADKTATVTATINTLDGLKTATATVTVSTAAPVVKELNVLAHDIAYYNSDDDGVTPGDAWTQDDLPDAAVTKLTYDTIDEDAWQLGVNVYLVGKDQYGVWSDLTTATVIVSTTNYCPYNAFTLAGGKLTLAADPVVYTAGKDLKVTLINGQAVKEITVQILAN